MFFLTSGVSNMLEQNIVVCVIMCTSEKQCFFLQLEQPASLQINLDIQKDLAETLQLLD